MSKLNVTIIRTNSSEEKHSVDFDDINPLINAHYLDTVNLRDGRIMLVDDNGYETSLVERGVNKDGAFVFESVPIRARKPVNEKATKLYHSVCIPGTTHQIVGDVAIVNEEELR